MEGPAKVPPPGPRSPCQGRTAGSLAALSAGACILRAVVTAAEGGAMGETATEVQVLTCPECGKTFSRPASLGAHRRQQHGVGGSSRATVVDAPPKPRGRPRTQAPADGVPDHDRLLALVFPAGLPASSAVLGEAQAWLAEADRLAR